jgi:Bardet-Biedl syndrome 2 protein
MLVPAFKLELNNAILKGMATVGKCTALHCVHAPVPPLALTPVPPSLACPIARAVDGRHPSLACATSGGKVFLHSAHATGGEGAVRFLSINRQITALAAGACARKVSAAAAAAADGDGDDGDGGDGVALDGDARPDALFVGSATNLLCYDVERNADLYFAEVPDGVNAMAHGTMPGLALGGGAGGGGMGGGMAIVGGNCSVQGFDAEGNEAFWTVTGGNVSAMAAHDVLGGVGGGGSGGGGGLLVGSDDFAIRSFVGEEVHAEVTETERVTELCSLWPPRHSGGGGGGGGSANSAAAASSSSFGYALGNGTVGVYNGSARAWRVKSKHRATALAALDVNGDGVPELISGWSNGKVEARAAGTGEVLFRDVMGSGGSAATPVSALACADYRLDGRQVRSPTRHSLAMASAFSIFY